MSLGIRAGMRRLPFDRAAPVDPIVAELEEVRRRQKLYEVLEPRFNQIAERCFDPTQSSKPLQIVAVSSAVSGEGTTTVATGLAAAAARNIGGEALLIETNVAKPVLARDFDVDETPGLAQYLDGTADIEQIIRRTRGAWLLPSGSYAANPGPLLRSERMDQLFDSLRGLFAAVVLDVPPLLTNAHAPLLVRRGDAFIMTCRAGSTHSGDVRRAIESAGDVELRGLILNRTRNWVPRWLARASGMTASNLD